MTEKQATGTESKPPADAVSLFLENLDKALSPHMQECYSEETRKLRNAVLSVALILILLGLGAIDIANEGSFAGIKFEPKAKYVLQVAAAVVEGFLLLVLAIRCYVEWSAWRLKNLSPEWTLLALHLDLSAATLARLTKEEAMRGELRDLILKGQYGAETNRISQALLESSTGEIAERQRAMSSLIDSYLPKAQFAKRARMWIEGLFPLAFGLFAVVVAVR